MSLIATPLTVADLSRHYDIPEKFLRSWGLADGPDGVVTPWFDAAGHMQATLLRTSIDAAFARGWPAGQRQTPWGLWCLLRARQRGQLFVVFSEPDAWVLWRHMLPTLALPDPTALESEYLAGNPSLVIHRGPLHGGDQRVERVRVRLQQLDYPGRACELRLLSGHVSIADLYRAGPQEFSERLQDAVREARPLRTPRNGAASRSSLNLADYEKRWPSRLYLPPASESSFHPGAACLSADAVLTTTPARVWDERAWLQSQMAEKLLYYLGHARGEAMRFLQTELCKGPRPAKSLLAAARTRGLSPRTLKRAKKSLGIQSQRRASAAGSAEWVWTLPDLSQDSASDRKKSVEGAEVKARRE